MTKERSLATAIPLILNIIIPAVATWLFVKSMIHKPGKTPTNMGKALFFTLLMGVIISVCSSAATMHVFNNRKDLIQDIKVKQGLRLEKVIQEDSTIALDKKPLKIKEAKENLETNLTAKNFMFAQVPFIMGICMVMSLIVFLYHFKNK